MHALVLKGLSKSNFRLLFHRFCLAPAMEWRGRRPLRTVARWSKGLLIPLLLSYYNAITYCIIKKIEAGCVYIRVCKRCFSKKEKLDWWRGRRRLTARYACMTQTCRPFGIFLNHASPEWDTIDETTAATPRPRRVRLSNCPVTFCFATIAKLLPPDPYKPRALTLTSVTHTPLSRPMAMRAIFFVSCICRIDWLSTTAHAHVSSWCTLSSTCLVVAWPP
jgi:hypothetical protein